MPGDRAVGPATAFPTRPGRPGPVALLPVPRAVLALAARHPARRSRPLPGHAPSGSVVRLLLAAAAVAAAGVVAWRIRRREPSPPWPELPNLAPATPAPAPKPHPPANPPPTPGRAGLLRELLDVDDFHRLHLIDAGPQYPATITGCCTCGVLFALPAGRDVIEAAHRAHVDALRPDTDDRVWAS